MCGVCWIGDSGARTLFILYELIDVDSDERDEVVALCDLLQDVGANAEETASEISKKLR